MRLTVLILSSIVLSISCKSTNKTKTANDAASAEQQASAHPVSVDKHLLIEELKKMKADFASRDRERIASIFSFPLSDSLFSTVEYDSAYLKEFNENGHKTTRAMFIKYFDETYKYMQMEEINELFKYLDIDKLNSTDSLNHEVRSSKEPCLKFYEMNVSGDTVTLMFGTNSNPDYVDPDKNSNEDEKIGDECEFDSWWVFQFDERRLHFKYQSLAG